MPKVRDPFAKVDRESLVHWPAAADDDVPVAVSSAGAQATAEPSRASMETRAERVRMGGIIAQLMTARHRLRSS
ncbi:hypothetical protein TUM20985_42810 [Mycobacterium antarcticum]|nr:hypothetical protein TUM20985_42810 [Mycolicibacterium sp. TUM20985]GLP76902.1 hypothetical protein TUM20983_40120 [Mycolicibacterium sp. TUM20983]GLP82677.1 hypothetical protein TUM20984_40970 [Mycolicibacterium sp. TUM20984]